MSFNFKSSSLFPEVICLSGTRHLDQRGFFCETFRNEDFESNGLPKFVQENHSWSKGGTFRGLHYQENPKAQGKLVYCISGLIWDYVIDIRKESPTYGRWEKFILNGNNGKAFEMIYIPNGFAHGFYVPDVAHVIYKVTEYYSPDYEKSIRYNDPDINLDIIDYHISVSDKDKNALLLKDADNNF